MARELSGGARLANDGHGPGTPVPDALAGLRLPLTPQEATASPPWAPNAPRLWRAPCATWRPSERECELAARIAAALEERRLLASLILVGGARRRRAFRHPIPTDAVTGQDALAIIVGIRGGLNVSCSRTVCAGAPHADLEARHRAACAVEAAMIAATRPGRSWESVVDVAKVAYADAGFPDEWRAHFQGGPVGYLSREFDVVPGTASAATLITLGAGFAWNPTVQGAQVGGHLHRHRGRRAVRVQHRRLAVTHVRYRARADAAAGDPPALTARGGAWGDRSAPLARSIRLLVPGKGIEPLRAYAHSALNAACLPVPPPRRDWETDRSRSEAAPAGSALPERRIGEGVPPAAGTMTSESLAASDDQPLGRARRGDCGKVLVHHLHHLCGRHEAPPAGRSRSPGRSGPGRGRGRGCRGRRSSRAGGGGRAPEAGQVGVGARVPGGDGELEVAGDQHVAQEAGCWEPRRRSPRSPRRRAGPPPPAPPPGAARRRGRSG